MTNILKTYLFVFDKPREKITTQVAWQSSRSTPLKIPRKLTKSFLFQEKKLQITNKTEKAFSPRDQQNQWIA